MRAQPRTHLRGPSCARISPAYFPSARDGLGCAVQHCMRLRDGGGSIDLRRELAPDSGSRFHHRTRCGQWCALRRTQAWVWRICGRSGGAPPPRGDEIGLDGIERGSPDEVLGLPRGQSLRTPPGARLAEMKWRQLGAPSSGWRWKHILSGFSSSWARKETQSAGGVGRDAAADARANRERRSCGRSRRTFRMCRGEQSGLLARNSSDCPRRPIDSWLVTACVAARSTCRLLRSSAEK